jgi:hypothetical protein
MFQSVYDYPFLSSSANHIFDIAIGYASDSHLSGSTNTQNSKKINIYNQMAQVLMGYDHTGSVLQFDEDGDITGGGTKLKECFFLNFSRLLVKDEIKKGTFQLDLGVKSDFDQGGEVFERKIQISDPSGSGGFKVNSPVGEYGILFATASVHNNILAANQNYRVGLIFYQAGVVVISGSVFHDSAKGGILNQSTTDSSKLTSTDGYDGYDIVTGSTIEVMSDAIRNRIANVQFNNTTELNSAIYFCRMNHNDFNYSTNPTYLNDGEIRVKTKSTDVPIAYVTTIGLYNSNNELMATAKLSEPLRKDPSQEYTIRCRLDF